MEKEWATWRLGGVREAALWLGLSPEFYTRGWPDTFDDSGPGRVLQDRVYAAIMRKEHAHALGLTHARYVADWRNKSALRDYIARVSLAAVFIGAHKGPLPPELDRLRDVEPPPPEPKPRRKPRGKALETLAAG